MNAAPFYYDIFKGAEDVAGNFETTLPDRIEILVAAYSYGNYSGDAFVLYRLDGELFEVNGSHCSCYGLEGQWKPEKTTPEAVLLRVNQPPQYSDYVLNEPEVSAAIRAALAP